MVPIEHGAKNSERIVLGNKPLRNYLLDIVLALNRGADEVEILGKGRHINRAVTLYNMLSGRLGDSLHLDKVEIGSVHERGRRISYIKIVVSRKIA
ncbi:MAG: DNA-binding protein [Thermoprotei archaeon]|nr:MAG: DNA-binding protein [Thermoprotei archaeon]